MKTLIIIGAGGLGQETVQLIKDINQKTPEWELLGFVDDAPSLQGQSVQGFPVLGTIDWLNVQEQEYWMICSISNPRIKQQAIERIRPEQRHYATLVHPTAEIAGDAIIGIDVIIQTQCIVSVNVDIGDHVQLNPQCGIGHGTSINEFCSLYWNVTISGNVELGNGVLMGSKSIVIQDLSIGKWSTIGAAANVIRNLPANCIAVGSPARVIRSALL